MSASFCHRCGSRVVCRAFGEGKVTLITVSQLLETAYWCPNCAGLLCGSCGGLNPPKKGTSLMIGTTAFCPVCSQPMETAEEPQMTAAVSAKLRRPPPKQGVLARIFGPPPTVAGSLAFFFVVTRDRKPEGEQAAFAYLHDVKTHLIRDDQPISEDCKFAVAYEMEPGDRAQLVKWASETFKTGFETLSTRYDLAFLRYEHASGSGQVVTALHRGGG